MKFNFGAALIPGFLVCSPAIAQDPQDLYRCDHPDGRIVYQASKCSIGVRQTAIDSQNAKREKFKQAQERERQRRKQKTKTKTTAGQPEQPTAASDRPSREKRGSIRPLRASPGVTSPNKFGAPVPPLDAPRHSVQTTQAGNPQHDGAHDKDGEARVNTLRERSAKALREGAGE